MLVPFDNLGSYGVAVTWQQKVKLGGAGVDYDRYEIKFPNGFGLTLDLPDGVERYLEIRETWEEKMEQGLVYKRGCYYFAAPWGGRISDSRRYDWIGPLFGLDVVWRVVGGEVVLLGMTDHWDDQATYSGSLEELVKQRDMFDAVISGLIVAKNETGESDPKDKGNRFKF